MYGILFEASSADDTIMDTDLIDECVKAIALIEACIPVTIVTWNVERH